jgi:hypothetical protein
LGARRINEGACLAGQKETERLVKEVAGCREKAFHENGDTIAVEDKSFKASEWEAS